MIIVISNARTVEAKKNESLCPEVTLGGPWIKMKIDKKNIRKLTPTRMKRSKKLKISWLLLASVNFTHNLSINSLKWARNPQSQ